MLNRDGAEGVTSRNPKDLFANSDSEGEDADTILGRNQQSQKSSYELRQEKVCSKV